MTRYRSSGLYFFLGVLAFFGGKTGAAVSIIPLPNSMTLGAGTLALPATVSVPIYRDAASDSTLPWVEKLFKQAKIPTTRVQSAAAAKVVINMAPDATLGAEGYKLSITATQIVITAPTLTGQFYALQSLRQVFPVTIEDSLAAQGSIALPMLEITDKPRFEYRGCMIDPVRHFLPLPYLYEHLDRMALYKMNRLHLLLSNDQGWRIESKVFPLLHEKGSVTQVGGGQPPAGVRWYYTQDEMRAVVKYAAMRKIKIIPEIDMPGHCTAMVVCYPKLGTYSKNSSDGANPTFTAGIRSNEDVQISTMNIKSTDADRPYVLNFIGQLWREMATIFPGDQYQMGGDEWAFSLDAPNYASFVKEVQDTLTKIGKRTIAWDEVKSNGGLRPNNWSQDWHQGSANVGDIASNCNAFYLDHHNEANDGANVLNWCGNEVTLSTVYSAPTSNTLKGVEAIMFAERLITYPDHWDRQIWPRITAVAEVGWVPANNGLVAYMTRLGAHGARFSSMGIKYFSTHYANLTWQTAPLHAGMINLYGGFVPEITPDVTAIRPVAHAKVSAAGKRAQGFNSLGRRIRLTSAGFPESAPAFIKP